MKHVPYKICEICSQEFYVRPYRLVTARYCSRKCKDLAVRRSPTFICRVCKVPKTPDDFGVDRSRSRSYVAVCKLCARSRQKTIYRFSPAKRYSELKQGAKTRSYLWDLSFDAYLAVFWGAPCLYCGDPANGGIDRFGNEPFLLITKCCFML